MNRTRMLGDLFLLELKRAWLPTLRSLIAPLLLGASAVLGTGSRPDLLLAAVGVGMALAAVAVGLQVGRDRDHGTLQYFAAMPIPGEILAGARFLAVLVCCAAVGGLALLVAALVEPALSGAVMVRGMVATVALCVVFGWVVVALLSRYSWTAIITWPVIIMVAGGFLLDLTGLGHRLSTLVAPMFTGSALGNSLLVLVILLWALVLLTALGAFALAMSGLQPNGGMPTADALATLAAYHRTRPQE